MDSLISPSELHILFILLDSNLPTGGFVSSSGLESWVKHGHFTPATTDGDISAVKTAPAERLVQYAQMAVGNYALSTVGFVKDAWWWLDSVGRMAGAGTDKGKGKSKDFSTDHLAIEGLLDIDDQYDAMTLNHVTRRASTAQGIALLTLFSKGFSVPSYMAHSNGPSLHDSAGDNDDGHADGQKEDVDVEGLKSASIEEFKRMIRRGEAAGHLPICWGLLSNAMGLSLDRAIHLHLFLHIRSLLSSAVRLNLIGPYASSQLLTHPLRKILEKEVRRCISEGLGISRGKNITIDFVSIDVGSISIGESDEWAWAEQHERSLDHLALPEPATNWPLGELVMGRHDLQQSRIFNS